MLGLAGASPAPAQAAAVSTAKHNAGTPHLADRMIVSPSARWPYAASGGRSPGRHRTSSVAAAVIHTSQLDGVPKLRHKDQQEHGAAPPRTIADLCSDFNHAGHG